MRRGCQVLLPAVVGSALLVIALPPLLDLRWWGAVLPAQILLLGALPAAIAFVRTACAENDATKARRLAAQALGGVAIVALAMPYGLVAVATAVVAQAAVMAGASLWPIRRVLGRQWSIALSAAARPCAGAAAAGALLFALAGPVGLMLDPVPAFCLLTASGWLCYLVIRGEPSGAERPAIWLRPRASAAPAPPSLTAMAEAVREFSQSSAAGSGLGGRDDPSRDGSWAFLTP